jgi:serine/threonine protein kinase
VVSTQVEAAEGVREGDVLAGKYRVERVLGAGAMGVVVAARHLQLETQVALKFLLPAMMGHPEAVARFAREARAAVRIKSEHVARVLDVGTLDTGAPYIVMEFLEGIDLAKWLQTKGPLPVEQTSEFVLQVCEAVAEAHSLGIVHRDLKPANLFCIRRPDGVLSVKVLDFGISKVGALGSASDAAMTQAAALMGSPLYMSPEQMQSSRDVDARTDIWALGVVIYELLSGSLPFSGQTIPEICIKIATAQPPSLDQLAPHVPAGMRAVIAKCLQKNRDQRYHDVAELAQGLSDFAPARARTSVERTTRTIQQAGLAAPPTSSPDSSADSNPHDRGGPGHSVAPLGRTTTGSSRRRAAMVWIGLAAGALIVVGAIALFRLSRSEPAAAAKGIVHPEPATEPHAEPLPNPGSTASAAPTASETTAVLAVVPPVEVTPKEAAKPAKPTPRAPAAGAPKVAIVSAPPSPTPVPVAAPNTANADPFARLKAK